MSPDVHSRSEFACVVYPIIPDFLLLNLYLPGRHHSMRALRWARSVWGWPTDLSWTFHLHCHCLGFCFQWNVAVAVGRQVLHLTGDLGKWWCSISIRVTPASLPVAISLMLVVWPFFGESRRWTWCPWPCITWNIFGSQMSCSYRYSMIRTHVLWKSYVQSVSVRYLQNGCMDLSTSVFVGMRFFPGPGECCTQM